MSTVAARLVADVLLGMVALLVGCGARTQLADVTAADPDVPDSACAPIPCPSDLVWDASSCACVGARCADDGGEVTIAEIDTEFAQGTAITVRDGVVYWTTRAGKDDAQGVVSKVSRCGGAVTTLASKLQGPTALATDGTRVFFGTLGGGPAAIKGALQSVATSGGAVTTIASGAIYQRAITTDSTNVYWTSETTSFGVWKAPLAGGAPTPIGPDQVFDEIAVDATRAFLSQPASIPANSKLLSMPLGGGPLKELVSSNLVFPGVMVIDDASVYCVVAPNQLVKVPKDGGAQTVLAHAEFNALAVDRTNVYWAQGDATTGVSGGIERVSKTGGAVTEVSKSYGYALAIDEAYAYWLIGGEVRRSPK